MKERARFHLLDESSQDLEYAQKKALEIMDKLERFREDITSAETSLIWEKILSEVRWEIETTSIIKDVLVFKGASPETGKPDPIYLEMAIMRIQNLLYLHYNSHMEKKSNKISSYLLEMRGASQELSASQANEEARTSLKLKLGVIFEKIKKNQKLLRIARGELSFFLLMTRAQQEITPPNEGQ